MGFLLPDQRLRAMYRGGRGDRTARRFARLWAGVFALGLAPRRWVTLEVRGRRSGRTVRFPLGMADWQGDWYLVSMLGEQCNWVRNVRAAEGEATLRHRGPIRCQLVEVPPGQRAPIIKRYLEKVPGARPHLPVDHHAAIAEFEAVSSFTPVFLVVPGTGLGRDSLSNAGSTGPPRRRAVRPTWSWVVTSIGRKDRARTPKLKTPPT